MILLLLISFLCTLDSSCLFIAKISHSVSFLPGLLPQSAFFRINRSYIINREQMDSFDNNDVFIKSYEIAIGNSYRDSFFEELMGKRE